MKNRNTVEYLNDSRTLFVLMWLSMLGALAFQLQPILLGMFAEKFSLDDQQVGFIASLELFSMFIACGSAYWWLRSLNWNWVFLLSTLGVLIGFYLVSTVVSYEQLLMVRGGAGFFHGAMYVTAMSALCDTRNSDAAVGYAVAMMLLGASVFYAFLPNVYANYGMGAVFCVLSVASISGFICAFLSPSCVKHNVQKGSAKFSLKSTRWALIFTGCLLVYQISLSAIWAFFERMAEFSGIAMQDTGNVLAIAVPLSALGGVLSGWVASRLGRPKAMLLAAMGIVVSLWLMGSVAGIAEFFTGVLGVNFFWNFGMAYFFSLVSENDSSGRFVVFAPVAQMLGNAIGPGLMGLLLTGNGYGIVSVTSSVAATFGVALALLAIFWQSKENIASAVTAETK